jgi:hypothetical protein
MRGSSPSSSPAFSPGRPRLLPWETSPNGSGGFGFGGGGGGGGTAHGGRAFASATSTRFLKAEHEGGVFLTAEQAARLSKAFGAAEKQLAALEAERARSAELAKANGALETSLRGAREAMEDAVTEAERGRADAEELARFRLAAEVTRRRHEAEIAQVAEGVRAAEAQRHAVRQVESEAEGHLWANIAADLKAKVAALEEREARWGAAVEELGVVRSERDALADQLRRQAVGAQAQ